MRNRPEAPFHCKSPQEKIYTTQKSNLDGARNTQCLQSDSASDNSKEETVTSMLQHLLGTYNASRALYTLSLIFATPWVDRYYPPF